MSVIKKEKILIVGGDERQRKLYDLLRRDSYEVTALNNKTAQEGKVFVFPIPVSKDKRYIYSDNANFKLTIDDALKNIKKDSIVFGGSFSEEMKEFFEKEEIEYHDLMESELFILQNAYYTSQGALRLLLENTEEYLQGKSVLVTGFGRISSSLCKMLKALGLKVSVLARNEIQLLNAKNAGYTPIEFSEYRKQVNSFNFIFNTIPNRIFERNEIESLKDGAIYFELASAPFGADKKDFEESEKKFVLGASLPGRFLSYSSALLIADYIKKYI